MGRVTWRLGQPELESTHSAHRVRQASSATDKDVAQQNCTDGHAGVQQQVATNRRGEVFYSLRMEKFKLFLLISRLYAKLGKLQPAATPKLKLRSSNHLH